MTAKKSAVRKSAAKAKVAKKEKAVSKDDRGFAVACFDECCEIIDPCGCRTVVDCCAPAAIFDCGCC